MPWPTAIVSGYRRVQGTPWLGAAVTVLLATWVTGAGAASDLPRYTLGTLPEAVSSRTRLPPPLLDTAIEYFQQMPTPRRMKLEKLLQKMGKDFDSKWMSIENPRHNSVEPPWIDISRQQELAQLELKELNFTYTDEDGTTVQIKPSVQKIMEKWLLEKSSCRVAFLWQDIGAWFWPRWVRKGVCADDRPCSWPPGMYCVPAESHAIQVLRWHCRPRRSRTAGRRNRKRKPPKKGPDDTAKSGKRRERERERDKKYEIKCRWIKVPYPVTSECFCSC